MQWPFSYAIPKYRSMIVAVCVATEEVGRGQPLVIKVAQWLVSHVTSRRLNDGFSAVRVRLLD